MGAEGSGQQGRHPALLLVPHPRKKTSDHRLPNASRARHARELEHVSRKARVQSARVLEVPIPELSDRGIRTGVADPRIDGPALTGFRLLDYCGVVGPTPNQRPIEHVVLS